MGTIEVFPRLPPGHVWQEDESFKSDSKPAGHIVQLNFADTGVNVCGAHILHVRCAFTFEYLPGLHGEHTG